MDSTRKEKNVQLNEKSLHKEDWTSWRLVFFVFMLNLCLGINSTQFAVLYTYITEYFESTKDITGWIGSIQRGATMTCGILMSVAVNLYGCRVVAVIASLLYFVAVLLSSMMPNVWCLYARTISWTSLSVLYLSSAVVIQKMFHKNRTLATGITLLGTSVGNMVGPVITDYLAAHYGWRGALLIMSALLGHMIPTTLMFPSFHVEQRNIQNTSNKSNPSTSRSLDNNKSSLCHWLSLWDFSVLKKPTFILFCISFTCFMFNTNSYYDHVIGRAIENGVPRSKAAYLVSLIALGSLSTRVICSFVGNLQCSNSLVIYTVGVLLGAAGSLTLTLTTEFYGMLILSIVHGVHLGFANTMVSVCAVYMVGTERIAAAQGLLNFFCGICAFITVPLSGWLYEVTQDYNVPFYATGAIGLIGTACSISALIITCCKQSEESTKESKGYTVTMEICEHENPTQDA